MQILRKLFLWFRAGKSVIQGTKNKGSGAYGFSTVDVEAIPAWRYMTKGR